MSRVGFTGTRRSALVSLERLNALEQMLRDIGVRSDSEFHHGDCIGMDAIASDYAEGFGFILHSHPADLDRQRAHMWAHYEHDAKQPLARNRDIVQASDLLIAVPVDPEREVVRSGTWATVRFARSIGKEVVIL